MHMISQVETHTCCVHNASMDYDDRPEAAIRLEQARAARGFESAAAACKYFGWNYVSYTQHEAGIRGIPRAAEKYAKAFRVGAGWLLTGDGSGPDDSPQPQIFDVPLVSWISAGELTEQITVMDFSDLPTQSAAGLGKGDWIALRVDGPSMNKISPPDSIIFVDTSDQGLVKNGLYVIADETGQATYKRYEPDQTPSFQPASYKEVKAPALAGAIKIIGRVRRSVIDM